LHDWPGKPGFELENHGAADEYVHVWTRAEGKKRAGCRPAEKKRGGKGMIADQTLRMAADRRNLLVGAACSPHLIAREPEYAQTLAREFNCLVAENCMKAAYVQPERGRFDFGPADRLVAFAEENRMRVRGHTLVWHNQMPEWMKTAGFSREEALGVMRDHIRGVLAHFKGRVFCWDVVNEALADGGGWRMKSPWFQMIGPDYVEAAFRFAREADPDVLLFYNDYGMDQPGSKADECYRMVRDFLDRGVPIDGVGFQYHLGVENHLDRSACAANVRRFRELGLAVHFTEMDMGIRKPITDELRSQQASEYANRVGIALDAGVSALVFWGFTDKYSWVPSFTKGEYDEPLLFDSSYRPKPAWKAVFDALAS